MKKERQGMMITTQHNIMMRIGQYLERENESSDSEPLINNELMNITEEVELNISAGTAMKKRGTVYCRKLTLLPPGGKLNVEFDEDGVAIGDNASLFSFFLGQQVHNKSVCPIQVKGWNKYTSEILYHLWACIQEKWSFDDPEQKRECVMKHAQRLFRYARSKLKRKYFSKLTTKEERLKNKPSHLKLNGSSCSTIGVMIQLWRRVKKQVKVGLIKKCLTTMVLKASVALDKKLGRRMVGSVLELIYYLHLVRESLRRL
ncbi:uncharacterized protein LOC110707480 [Chenopodium quinoa]|uniref:uncharacterized protein LOC110707480 n=1 Tax=Chenopodium quinoa TaxID=63459 RepID=UPI000B770F7A|nr:uncharacterized protein LOC110707480 [Chenopodium quinoa]